MKKFKLSNFVLSIILSIGLVFAIGQTSVKATESEDTSGETYIIGLDDT